jgi:CheY-like chemotaxis protein
MKQDACEPVVALVAETEELAKLDESSGQSMAPDAPGEPAEKIRVLLVEDEALIAEIIGEALIDAGHEVHSVANAEDALEHLSGGARVDVLFTDINLPGEMDGAVLAERARKSDPKLAVIYASGRWALLEELRGRPNAAILQKPYSPARACEAVETLAAARGEDSGHAERKAKELALAL